MISGGTVVRLDPAARRRARIRALVWTVFLPWAAAAQDRADALPRALAKDGDWANAALEFRRLALAENDPAPRTGWHWASAWSYTRAGRADASERQLDQVERERSELRAPVMILRAENAEARHDRAAAQYFWESLSSDPEGTVRGLAARRSAALKVRSGDLPGARRALAAGLEPPADALDALARYERAERRNPRIGGLLGLIPGLGYAYSGEFANAARSAVLNGLFIWILTRTAGDESWGAFALAGFFEATWYTGSIYGGIDAAHRWNRRLEDEAVRQVIGGASAEPDWSALPLIQLRFRF
jgi:hypothetical protein